ncbi:MauE/DoxX family redox-associated membrane protein [Streptomyces sp. NPDC051940]|uniref:MauE/DoxX family redox-associated membrane protein n=1 Tax=Streptomyces sp. NPDC051940 TaxID=3155675 RepID=UPI00342B27BD
MPYVLLACRLTLVAVLLLAAAAKLRAPRAFAASLTDLTFVPRPLRRPLAVLVPAVELLVAGLLAVPATGAAGFAAAVPLTAALTAVPVLVVARGETVSCACFGVREVPLGALHIVRNGALLTAAGLGAYFELSGAAGVDDVPGALLAVAAAAVLTTLIVFTDDIAVLLRAPAVGVPGGGGR